MRYHKRWKRFICLLCSICVSFSVCNISVDAEATNVVSASTNTSVKQGNTADCYVKIESLENLAAIDITVHFDSTKIKIQEVKNSVSCLVYDSTENDSNIKFSYIFDGKGAATKTTLFNFKYQVLSDAEVGETYFDIVVGDAYDNSLNEMAISGSRCEFSILETVTTKSCTISGTSTVSSSVEKEFALSYRFSTNQLASGSVEITYDAELFEVVSVTEGNFLTGKLTDINTELSGRIYLSFVGLEYSTSKDIVTVQFRTLKNTNEKSQIVFHATELCDIDLNSVSCSGYTTTVNVSYDDEYVKEAAKMSASATYNKDKNQAYITIDLEKNSKLGAGDFVLKFDSEILTLSSYEKGISPTFFNVNDKEKEKGILKFSIISLEDIVAAGTVLRLTFDMPIYCEDVMTDFELTGSGLCDSLTNKILLNFIDTSLLIPGAGHDEEFHEAQEVSCLEIGWEAYVTCSRCDYTTYNEIPALGHDEVYHEAKEETCTEIGWDAYVTCNRCDYTTYNEIPALGHDEVYHEAKEETCTEIGWDAYVTCSRCDYSTYSERHMLGHDEIYHEAKAPTCTEIGWDAYVTCNRCNYTTYNEIPALGHDEIYHEAKEPNCIEIGWESYITCGRCAYSTYNEIPPIAHTLVNIEEQNDSQYPFVFDGGILQSTNKNNNTTSVYTITAMHNCAIVLFGKVSSESSYDILSIAHNGDIIASLSGEKDWQEYSLKLRVGDVVTVSYRKDGSQSHGKDTAWFYYQVEIEDEIFHEAKAPTCTDIGWDAYVTCTRCDYTTYNEKAALGHDEVYHEAKDATCTEIGWDAYVTCSRCDYTTYNEKVSIGHNEVYHEAKAPTCTEVGWHEHVTCSRCEYTTYEEIPANGHSFVQTICTVCGDAQPAINSWDISADGQGGLIASIYRNYVDGGYELVITGSGAMANYSYSTAPWYNYRSSINRVELPQGLTSIGDYAFYYCTDLRQIWIPDSVERIGANGLSYNDKMVILFEGSTLPTQLGSSWNYGSSYYMMPQKVILEADATYVIDRNGNACLAKYIGSGKEFVARETVEGITVTHIGDYAFYNKSNLQLYWIKEEICSIGINAFTSTGGLLLLFEGDTFPTSLGSSWNGSCSYYLGAVLWSEGDFLFVRDNSNKVDIVCYQGNQDEVIIPAQAGGYSITRIRPYAFQNSTVKSLVLPEGIQSIGNYAFDGCRSLQQIQLPQSLTSIGQYAFQYCSSLQQIQLPQALKVIGDYSFGYCSSLKTIVIPEGVKELYGTFMSCNLLESVVLHDGITRLDGLTFYNCTSLKELRLPKNLQSISSFTFYNCRSLRELDLPEQIYSVDWSSYFTNVVLNVLYIRSSKLAATLTEAAWESKMLQKVKTIVVPAGTGTEYLIQNYPYFETIKLDGKDYDVYSLHAHNWQEEKVEEYVFNQSDGMIVHTCDICGVTYSEVIGHSYDNDCDTACNVCGDERVTEHNYQAIETKAPTCTEDGYTTYICEICDHEYKDDYNYANGHDFDNGICTVCDGYLEADHDYENSYDNTWVVYKKDAGSISITFSDDTYVEVGCDFIYIYDVNGNEVGKYTGAELAAQTITVSGNTVKVRLVTNSTETAYGFKVTDISVAYNMGDINDDGKVDGKDATILSRHLSGWEEYSAETINMTAADVYADGVVDGKDFVLLMKYLAEWDVTLGGCLHDEVIDAAVEPTCTQTGLTEGSHCSKCGEVLQEQTVVEETDHPYENDVCISCGKEKYSKELEFTSNGDGTCSVSGIGTCTDENVYIPPVSPSGDVVTSIESSAFAQCKSLTSIIIPEGVTSIGDSAFWGCSGLTNVIISEGVTTLGVCTFTGCSSLTSITIPVGVTRIGNASFWECSGLMRIVFEDETGWCRTTNLFDWRDMTGGTIIDLTNALDNATFFTMDYDGYLYKNSNNNE